MNLIASDRDGFPDLRIINSLQKDAEKLNELNPNAKIYVQPKILKVLSEYRQKVSFRMNFQFFNSLSFWFSLLLHVPPLQQILLNFHDRPLNVENCETMIEMTMYLKGLSWGMNDCGFVPVMLQLCVQSYDNLSCSSHVEFPYFDQM